MTAPSPSETSPPWLFVSPSRPSLLLHIGISSFYTCKCDRPYKYDVHAVCALNAKLAPLLFLSNERVISKLYISFLFRKRVLEMKNFFNAHSKWAWINLYMRIYCNSTFGDSFLGQGSLNHSEINLCFKVRYNFFVIHGLLYQKEIILLFNFVLPEVKENTARPLFSRLVKEQEFREISLRREKKKQYPLQHCVRKRDEFWILPSKVLEIFCMQLCTNKTRHVGALISHIMPVCVRRKLP